MCEQKVHIDLAMLIYYCKTINYYELYLKELGDSTQLKTLIQNVVCIFIRQSFPYDTNILLCIVILYYVFHLCVTVL